MVRARDAHMPRGAETTGATLTATQWNDGRNRERARMWRTAKPIHIVVLEGEAGENRGVAPEVDRECVVAGLVVAIDVLVRFEAGRDQSVERLSGDGSPGANRRESGAPYLSFAVASMPRSSLPSRVPVRCFTWYPARGFEFH